MNSVLDGLRDRKFADIQEDTNEIVDSSEEQFDAEKEVKSCVSSAYK